MLENNQIKILKKVNRIHALEKKQKTAQTHSHRRGEHSESVPPSSGVIIRSPVISVTWPLRKQDR